MSLLHAVGSNGADGKFDVDYVFSTYLYTGNRSTQTINNGIDLAGKGGMVWIKNRANSVYGHALFTGPLDSSITLSPSGNESYLSAKSGNISTPGGSSAVTFNSNGFTLGTDTAHSFSNYYIEPYTSWTFRKAPKFFDIVTYTGDGDANRGIPHSLGITPGLVIIKSTSSLESWHVWSNGSSYTIGSGGQAGKNYYTNLILDESSAATANGEGFSGNYITPHSASTFYISGGAGSKGNCNTSGVNYIAYIFAHDDSAEGFIKCGSYTGNGSATGPVVSLGWEPQYLMIKNASGTGNWQIIDNMRGMPVGSADAALQANLKNAESSVDYVSPTATGFQITSTSSEVNTSNSRYIYMAIRRSNKVPTSGTEVFQPVVYTGTNTDNRLVNTGMVTDMVWVRERNDTTPLGMAVASRLTGNSRLQTSSTAAVINDADSFMTPTVGYGNSFSAMDGFGVGNDATCKVNIDTTVNNHIALAFKRAKGFFDVITWTGDGEEGRHIPHSLGVRPILGITKCLNSTAEWRVSYGPTTLFADQKLLTFTTASTVADAGGLRMHGSTETTVYTDSYVTSNNLGNTYIGFLFATLPGISKVGQYTGNGSSQMVPCGFTTGTRFVLIRCKITVGDWYIWDTARGIVADNDPHLSLNSTAAEVTTDDSIDPEASGFVVNQNTATNINVLDVIYIFLAIS